MDGHAYRLRQGEGFDVGVEKLRRLVCSTVAALAACALAGALASGGFSRELFAQLPGSPYRDSRGL